MQRLNLQWLGLVVACAGFAIADLAANELHPEFPLLDADGRPVLLSGRPLSTMRTCGECHDTVFIESSSDHADAGAAQIGNGGASHDWSNGPGYFGGWDPLSYDHPVVADGTLDLDGWLQRFGPRHVAVSYTHLTLPTMSTTWWGGGGGGG